MSILLVTYDLNRNSEKFDGQNYAGVLKIIREYSNTRLSESSYAIDTTETPTSIYNKVKPALDKNDNLYVITLSKPDTGFGKKEVNNWLEQHLHQNIIPLD